MFYDWNEIKIIFFESLEVIGEPNIPFRIEIKRRKTFSLESARVKPAVNDARCFFNTKGNWKFSV